MKKTILIIFILLITSILFFMDYNIKNDNNIVINEEYEWNGGHCIEDGGKLKYVKTGSKNHYVCEICDKEYVFDKIMKYE